MSNRIKNILFVVGFGLFVSGLILGAIYLICGIANLAYKLF